MWRMEKCGCACQSIVVTTFISTCIRAFIRLNNLVAELQIADVKLWMWIANLFTKRSWPWPFPLPLSILTFSTLCILRDANRNLISHSFSLFAQNDDFIAFCVQNLLFFKFKRAITTFNTILMSFWKKLNKKKILIPFTRKDKNLFAKHIIKIQWACYNMIWTCLLRARFIIAKCKLLVFDVIFTGIEFGPRKLYTLNGSSLVNFGCVRWTISKTIRISDVLWTESTRFFMVQSCRWIFIGYFKGVVIASIPEWRNYLQRHQSWTCRKCELPIISSCNNTFFFPFLSLLAFYYVLLIWSNLTENVWTF